PADSSIGRPSPHSPYTTLFRSTPPSLNSRSSSSGTQTASTSAPGRQGSATSAVGGRKSPTEVGSEGASDAVGTGPPSSGNRTTVLLIAAFIRVPEEGAHSQEPSRTRWYVTVIERNVRVATSPDTWVGMPRCAESQDG